MHYVYNRLNGNLIAQTVCDFDLSQIKKECELNQVFYYVETFNDEEPITAQSLADNVIKVINEGDELKVTPNPNRFIKSSFTLSLLWIAKFYSHLAQVTIKPELRSTAFEAMRLMERQLSTFLAKDNDPFHFEFFFPSGRAFLGGYFW